MPLLNQKYLVEPPYRPWGCWRGVVIILIVVMFLVLIFTSCTEEVIVYRDRVDTVRTMIYRSFTLDTLRRWESKPGTTDTVEIIIVDTVEREATITYEPVFEPYVESFFALVDDRLGRSGMLQVSVHISDDIPPDFKWISYSEVLEGRWEIRIVNAPGCMEAAVYRELMHCLWGRDYSGVWLAPGDPEQVMTLNFPECLENHPKREELITEVFGI